MAKTVTINTFPEISETLLHAPFTTVTSLQTNEFVLIGRLNVAMNLRVGLVAGIICSEAFDSVTDKGVVSMVTTKGAEAEETTHVVG